MKRLIRMSEIKKPGVLSSPECFYSACNTVNHLFSLGYKWDDIKKVLISQFEPYNFSHPDLEVIHTFLSMQKGRDIK